jgi:enoyl-CoA hydratase/carnithine racemase
MTAPLLLAENRGAVRLLTLNRPDKLNALSMPLVEELLAALEAAGNDESTAVIVLAGAGRSFCAGADLAEFRDLVPEKQHLIARRANLTMELQSLLPALSKPVLAAVQGHAAGGGCGLALACDLVVAAEDAKFSYPEIRRGIVGAVVAPNLVRQVGTKAAFELLATGEPIGAPRAHEIGIVNRVVRGERLREAALALAARLAELPAAAMRATKELFYRSLDLPFAEALRAAHATHERMRAFPRHPSVERFSR